MGKPLWLMKAKAALMWRGRKFRKERKALRLLKKELTKKKTFWKQMPSAKRWPNIAKYGKLFLLTFPEGPVKKVKRKEFVVSLGGLGHESPIVLGVSKRPAGNNSHYSKHFVELNIGFEKNAVVIESMHGGALAQPDLDIFRQKVGKPAINYMVEMVEAHARRCGFKRAKICDPRTLCFYKAPEVLQGVPESDLHAYYSSFNKRQLDGNLDGVSEAMKKRVEDIRSQMVRLYETVANRMNYRKEGDFFVKDL